MGQSGSSNKKKEKAGGSKAAGKVVTRRPSQRPSIPSPQSTTAPAAVASIPGPMSRLSKKQLRRVFLFLPIDSVLIAMRVDKKWESAARYVVDHWESLTLGPLAACEDCWNTGTACPSCRKEERFVDGVIGVDGGPDFDVIRFLCRMKHLKRLEMKGPICKPVEFLFYQNVESLRVVTGVDKLPVSPTVTYNITRLECQVFTNQEATACPHLKELIPFDGWKFATQAIETENRRTDRMPDVHLPQVESVDFCYSDRDAKDFIARHARQLKELACNAYNLPLRVRRRKLVYEKLEILSCDAEDVSSFANFPNLKFLYLQHDRGTISLSDLPVHSLQVLTVQSLVAKVAKKTISRMAISCSQLQHLKYIDLRFGSQSWRDGATEFSKFFSYHEHLESVLLTAYGTGIDLSPVIKRLIRRNPRIKRLFLDGFLVSDELVESMSRLPKLQKLRIEKAGSSLTTRGLKRLMHDSASSDSLLRLCVDGAENVDADRVVVSFIRMLTRRGLDLKMWDKDPYKDMVIMTATSYSSELFGFNWMRKRLV